MRSSLGITTVLLLALGPPLGCEPQQTPGLEVVPEDAALVVGIDLAALHAWPVAEGSSLSRRIPHLEALSSASERCGIPLDKAAAHVALGGAMDQVLVVVSAPGVAKASTLRCAVDLVDEGSNIRIDENSEGAMLIAKTDGDAVIGVGRGEDLLVIAGKGWRDRLDAEPTPNGIWHVSARPQNAVWFAGRSPSFLPPSVGFDPATVESITGYVELNSDGLDLVATVTATDATAAETLRQTLGTMLEKIGPGLYLPPNAVESLGPGVDGNQITWDAELDASAIGSLDARWLGDLDIAADSAPMSLADVIDEAQTKGASGGGTLDLPNPSLEKPPPELDPALVTGIASCDEYITKYLRCMDSKFPDSAEQVRDALRQAADAWREAAKGPAADSIEKACQEILQNLGDSMSSLGCEW